MSMLFNEYLCTREFGSAVLSVPELYKWLNGKNLHLVTEPPLNEYDYAQVESVLCAIERSASRVAKADKAAFVVATIPALSQQNPVAEIAPAWLLGADAAQQWREDFRNAFENEELALLDAFSLRPVTTINAPAAKVEAVNLGITKQQVINAFEGLHFNRDQWTNALGKNIPNWLKECRVDRGKQGSKLSATWNPVLIAVALFDKKIPIKKLDIVFVSLKDWAEKWQEASASIRD
jgi:hypothetical protein